MARIGYARVSTTDQDLDIQLTKLKAEGCSIIRSEKVSGGSREGRAELATVIEFLREGDELVITRLDRLGRDTRDVLNLIYECEQRGAFVTVLDPHVSTRGEMGHVVITVLGMVAQMERRFIKERQRDGIEKAKAGGIYRGGRPRLDRKGIKEMAASGEKPSVIAKTLGCSRMQVYRILRQSQIGSDAPEISASLTTLAYMLEPCRCMQNENVG
jgi:DNA invertase Pin-like site-specific DNA recombinase